MSDTPACCLGKLRWNGTALFLSHCKSRLLKATASQLFALQISSNLFSMQQFNYNKIKKKLWSFTSQFGYRTFTTSINKWWISWDFFRREWGEENNFNFKWIERAEISSRKKSIVGHWMSLKKIPKTKQCSVQRRWADFKVFFLPQTTQMAEKETTKIKSEILTFTKTLNKLFKLNRINVCITLKVASWNRFDLVEFSSWRRTWRDEN